MADFDIEAVERLELGPDEILIVKTPNASPRQVDDFIEWTKTTPLADKVLVLGPGSDMEIVRVAKVERQIQRKQRPQPREREPQTWENVFPRDRL